MDVDFFETKEFKQLYNAAFKYALTCAKKLNNNKEYVNSLDDITDIASRATDMLYKAPHRYEVGERGLETCIVYNEQSTSSLKSCIWTTVTRRFIESNRGKERTHLHTVSAESTGEMMSKLEASSASGAITSIDKTNYTDSEPKAVADELSDTKEGSYIRTPETEKFSVYVEKELNEIEAATIKKKLAKYANIAMDLCLETVYAELVNKREPSFKHKTLAHGSNTTLRQKVTMFSLIWFEQTYRNETETDMTYKEICKTLGFEVVNESNLNSLAKKFHDLVIGCIREKLDSVDYIQMLKAQ